MTNHTEDTLCFAVSLLSELIQVSPSEVMEALHRCGPSIRTPPMDGYADVFARELEDMRAAAIFVQVQCAGCRQVATVDRVANQRGGSWYCNDCIEEEMPALLHVVREEE